jgi:5'-AMP-activated protein kinase catalytic alpha subunit
LPKELSEEAKDLIKNILNTNPETRFSLEQIKRHSWYNLVKPRNKLEGIIVGFHRIPVRELKGVNRHRNILFLDSGRPGDS